MINSSFYFIKNLMIGFSSLPKQLKAIIFYIIDIIIYFFSTYIIYLYYYKSFLETKLSEYLFLPNISFISIVLFILYLIFIKLFRVNEILFRSGGLINLYNLIKANLAYALTVTLITFIFGIFDIYLILHFISLSLFSILLRIFTFLGINYLRNFSNEAASNILIYGAGEAGTKIYNFLIQQNKKPAAYIDDDIRKQYLSINNIKVYSKNDLAKLIKKYFIREILIAIPSLNILERKKMIELVSSHNLKISIMPQVQDLLDHKNFQNINMEFQLSDLVSRNILYDSQEIKNKLNNKSVLITGAGGSIGSELCKQIFFYNCKKIILIDMSEYNLFRIVNLIHKLKIEKKINTEIVSCLTNLCDKNNLENLINLHNPEIIFHAAAYKHVKLVEDNIMESYYNNVIGSKNLIDICYKNSNISNFILVSTDKAVRPSNFMGKTKRIIEIYLSNVAKQNTKIKYAVVRFGNVFRSSGSIVPIFSEQIKSGGPITVTAKEVERYFMSINEAVGLILESGLTLKPNNIFVLNMGKPIKIYDLACKMISYYGLTIKNEINPKGDIEIIFTGLSKGEKMYEELSYTSDLKETKNKDIFFVIENNISNDLNKTILEFDNLYFSNKKQKLLSKIDDFLMIID
tara:strand:- start:269 stop:2161 length:1893 start_codon:yes stop_codon:yes gene_type:complete